MRANGYLATCLVAATVLSCTGSPPSRAPVPPASPASQQASDCPATAPASEEQTSHYYDLNGNSLEGFDPIWHALSELFGSASPERITVVYVTGNKALFDPITDTIRVLDPGTRLVAHESAHLFISHLTNKVSVTQPFRFIDEGFASILGQQLSGARGFHRKESHNIAKDQQSKGFVSLAQLQQWKAYRAEHTPYVAYSVGSSFVYYLQDRHGKAKLIELLRSLGETQNLGRSSESALGASIESVFASWIEHLKTTPKHALPAEPAVLEFFPKRGAEDVPTDIKEISATFNVFMRPDLCVHNECRNTGLCYTNARWESYQRLLIPVEGRLLPGHRYQLNLGSTDGCKLRSSGGVEMPPMQWEFTTGE